MRDYKSYGKEVKRKAAEERNAYRATLSPLEQIERLKSRPGKSMRETNRLLAMMTVSKVADNKTNDSVVNKKLTSNEKMNRKVLHAQAALQAQK